MIRQHVNTLPDRSQKRFWHTLYIRLSALIERSRPAGQGFSLGELLVVVTLVVLLALTALLTYQHQMEKAYDTTRKDHFKKFRIAFEDYYSDNECYPTLEVWDGCTCGGSCLSPYMDSFLCDPNTKLPYFYYPFTDAEENPDTCMGYRLYTKLRNTGDPDIRYVGCSPVLGCGDGPPLSSYNYGISMGGRLTAEDFDPDATPTPTDRFTPGCVSSDGPWACNPSGTCNGGYEPISFSSGKCSVGFTTASCCLESGCPDDIRCKW